MIKSDNGDFEIKGDIVEVTTDIVYMIKKVIDSAFKENEDILLGAILTGIYDLKSKENYKKCYEIGKLLSKKCKEMREREHTNNN